MGSNKHEELLSDASKVVMICLFNDRAPGAGAT